MLERPGTGGGAAAAERAGIVGVPEVPAVVTAGWVAATAFGLGGMYGVSVSPLAAAFGISDAGTAELAMLSLRGIGTGAATCA